MELDLEKQVNEVIEAVMLIHYKMDIDTRQYECTCRQKWPPYWLQLEMWDEIFEFESFVNFFKYFKTPFLKFSLKFCILITIHR